ncbi:MAG: anthranilate phosphoribosyltransferase [Firmicutes bacterium]|nr:anthranilate phosphoribosyltransferase [Bacillota bacterium]
MIREAIAKLVQGQHLAEEEAREAMNEIMSGQATDAQIGAFVTGLRMKGETVEEITGCARVMREKVTRVSSGRPLLVDTCGTGGDGGGTFNISTAAAFVVAGAGLPVAKHGNRAVSSRAGSADCLEALGVKLDIGPEAAGACLDEVGICFLFAPAYHSAFKYVIGPRKEIGIRTVFNVLGPLTNPAGAHAQVIGVYEPGLVDLIPGVLRALGSRAAYVVHGGDGLDEFTLAGETLVGELRDGQVRRLVMNPVDLGLAPASREALRGGTAEENAAILREVLEGCKGPRRDTVLANAALAITAGGLSGDLQAGVEAAARSIDSGAAWEMLAQLVAFTSRA